MQTILEQQQLQLPFARSLIVQSDINDRTYTIYIYVPQTAVPKTGFPIIYVLDGNAFFNTVTDAIRLQARRADKTGIEPAVVVGIGYPSEEPFPSSRHYDFTEATDLEQLPAHPTGGQWPEHGGAPAFFQFIEKELKPYIEKQFAIDCSKQTLLGHSLGGLFTLYTMFNHPTAFQCYIAGSPSIHWNKAGIEKYAQQFSANLKAHPQTIKLLMAAGSLENFHKSGMNANAKQLTEKLQALTPYGMRAKYCDFTGENHISVVPVLINYALKFMQQSEQNEK